MAGTASATLDTNTGDAVPAVAVPTAGLSFNGTDPVRVDFPSVYTNPAGSGVDRVTITLTALNTTTAAKSNVGRLTYKRTASGANFTFNTTSRTANVVQPAVTVVKTSSEDANGPIGRLYWAYFLRPADFDGLQHWLATGLPLKRISEAFANTPEFRDRYGQLNNDGFVRLVYQNVMSRTPDDEGLQYWKSRLNSGFPRGEMMVGFSESPEFKLRRA